MDTGKLAASVAREREMSTKVISDLARAIGNVNHTPMAVAAKEDPFAVNMSVMKQLQKQASWFLLRGARLMFAGTRGELFAEIRRHYAAKLCSL